ncbi:MAG: 4'-phosphopantetheinyl transferase superfamily protein [Clostridia bacterium]|nr:4'-phosphopantetheinyl transferase superfamily protein [Clostridia bacterium]
METLKVYYIKTDVLKGKEGHLYSVLPEERGEKAKRYAKEDDRLLSLAAGYLAGKVVGRYFKDENGKPRADGVHFSLAHSGDIAVIAVNEHRDVGVDAEISQDKNFDDIANYALGEDELEAYRSGVSFLPLFTAKESLSKAEGRGLRNRTRDIPALPLDGAVEYKGKTYYRHTLEIPGYYASAVLEGEDFLAEIEELTEI